MNVEVSFWAFVGAMILGAGFRIGWGIIGMIFDALATATKKTT